MSARRGAALLLPGRSDLLLLAGPCTLASLFLLLREHRRRVNSKPKPRWIVVDGSNVLYWKDNTPRIETVREVVAQLAAQGYAPAVVFDANAGYLVRGRYQHDGAFGALLGLPEDRVMVVPKGTPADPAILTAARDHGARIVTNDRYRDWADQFPEVAQVGHWIRGGYKDGVMWLDIVDLDARAPEPAGSGTGQGKPSDRIVYFSVPGWP